jgi:hypothetical protein
MLSEVSASLDRVIGEVDALRSSPVDDKSPEIGQVQLSLGNLRGALQAQVEERRIDADSLLFAVDPATCRSRPLDGQSDRRGPVARQGGIR